MDRGNDSKVPRELRRYTVDAEWEQQQREEERRRRALEEFKRRTDRA